MERGAVSAPRFRLHHRQSDGFFENHLPPLPGDSRGVSCFGAGSLRDGGLLFGGSLRDGGLLFGGSLRDGGLLLGGSLRDGGLLLGGSDDCGGLEKIGGLSVREPSFLGDSVLGGGLLFGGSDDCGGLEKIGGLSVREPSFLGDSVLDGGSLLGGAVVTGGLEVRPRSVRSPSLLPPRGEEFVPVEGGFGVRTVPPDDSLSLRVVRPPSGSVPPKGGRRVRLFSTGRDSSFLSVRIGGTVTTLPVPRSTGRDPIRPDSPPVPEPLAPPPVPCDSPVPSGGRRVRFLSTAPDDRFDAGGF